VIKKSFFALVAASFISLLIMSLPGCGGGTKNGQGTGFGFGYPGNSGGGGCPTCVSIYVDATLGNDATGTGSASAPYKTITKTIQVSSAVAATQGANIYVASGVYNAGGGEVFPIMPSTGDNLIGAGNVQVSGTGATYTKAAGDYAGMPLSYVMVFTPGVTGSMTGISLGGSAETIGIIGATVTLTGNTFSGSTNVVLFAGSGAQLTLNSNTLNNGNLASVLVADAGTHVVARGNVISGCAQYGVVVGPITPISASAMDLGTVTSPGNNTILGGATVTGVGLLIDWITAGTTIQAVGNTWHPSTQGADASGHYAATLIPPGTPAVAGNNYANPANGSIQF